MASPDGSGAAPLRLGTRGSALALAQANTVAGLLRALGAAVDLVIITTQGDVRTDVPLATLGGVGVFAAELETALRRGEVDLAVHSAKDLPSTLTADMALAAFLPRVDVRDVIVSRGDVSLARLPHGAVVGTSSPRRACQLRAARPDLALRDIRGNVDTRLRKLDAGDYDAIVLAAAGLTRLGLTDRISERLTFDVMLPAPGQGAIAIETRADDARTQTALAPLDHRETRIAVTAERAFLARLGAGCAAPAAAYAVIDGDTLRMEGMIGSADGDTVRASRTGAPDAPAALGAAVAEALIADGGDALLALAGLRDRAVVA